VGGSGRIPTLGWYPPLASLGPGEALLGAFLTPIFLIPPGHPPAPGAGGTPDPSWVGPSPGLKKEAGPPVRLL